MSPDTFVNTLSVGLFDVTPTDVSIAIKAKDPNFSLLDNEKERSPDVSTDNVSASSMH